MDNGNIFWNVQTTVLLIFGMILQVLMGGKHGVKLILTVIVATLFVGWFITPAIIELFNIPQSSKLAQMVLAMSTLISVEIVALIITVAPKAVSRRVREFIGLDNVSE